MENTNPNGSENLNVNQGAAAFEAMMGDPDEAKEGQSEENPEAEEVAEYADNEELETQPEPKRYKVKVSGEEYEVDEAELIKGYQLEKDYRQKSQALAAERHNLEQVKQERMAYAQKLQALDSFLSQQDRVEDIDSLRETDPIGYAVRVAEQTQREKQLAVIRNEQQRLAQVQQAEHQSSLQNHLQSESNKLAKLIPELATPKGDAVRKEIREYAKSVGWTEQELSSVYDSRAVQTLYLAMKYQQLQKSKPDVQKRLLNAPKMLSAGSSAPPSKSANDKQVMQRLRETGKVSDAAKAFERFF